MARLAFLVPLLVLVGAGEAGGRSRRRRRAGEGLLDAAGALLDQVGAEVELGQVAQAQGAAQLAAEEACGVAEPGDGLLPAPGSSRAET